MAKAELGTKRIDPETGRKFYDLNKDPIVSPYTGKSYPLSFFEETSVAKVMETVIKAMDSQIKKKEQQLLAEKCGIQLKYAMQTIEVGTLEKIERDLLGQNCPRCTAIITRQTFDVDNNAVEFVESRYRSDRYLFRMLLELKEQETNT